MPPSVSLQNAIIEHFYRGNAQAARGATLFASLHTADPGRTGASEVSGSSYARQSVSFDAPAAGVTDGTADVLFPIVTGSQYIISRFGLWDAVTAGNFHDGAALTGGAKTIAVGSQFRLPSADIDLVAA